MTAGRTPPRTRAAAVCAVLFVVLTGVVASAPRWLAVDVDGRVAATVVTTVGGHTAWQATLRAVTWSGAPLVVDAIVLVGAAVLWRRRGWAIAVAVVGAGLASLVVREVVKTWLDRPRPVGGFSSATGGAFPSGHTAGAAFVAVAAMVVFARAWVVVMATTYALVVGASRILLDVHWLSDVVGGLLLGATFGLLVPWVRVRLGERPRVETLP